MHWNNQMMNYFIVAVVIGVICLILRDDGSHCKPKTYISNSHRGGTHGRGVFSMSDIEPNQIIETGPLIVSADDAKEDDSMFNDYLWSYSAHATSDHRLYKYAVALGNASICNHSNEPNANIKFQDKNYTLFAIRPIHKGDEILISYCQGKTPCLWGVSRNMTLIE